MWWWYIPDISFDVRFCVAGTNLVFDFKFVLYKIWGNFLTEKNRVLPPIVMTASLQQNTEHFFCESSVFYRFYRLFHAAKWVLSYTPIISSVQIRICHFFGYFQIGPVQLAIICSQLLRVTGCPSPTKHLIFFRHGSGRVIEDIHTNVYSVAHKGRRMRKRSHFGMLPSRPKSSCRLMENKCM